METRRRQLGRAAVYRLQLAKLLLDLVLWGIATPIAYWLRLDERLLEYWQQAVAVTLVVLPVKAIVAWRLGLWRYGWARLGSRDVIQILKAIGTVSAIMFVGAFVAHRWRIGVPRSVALIEILVASGLLVSVRYLAQLRRERRFLRPRQRGGPGRRILIVGAGEAGTLFAREMVRHPEAGMVPVGFVDDDPAKQRQRVLGFPVLGRIDDLANVAARHQVDEVVIAIPSASGDVVRRVVRLANEARVRHRIVPALHQLLSGSVSITQLREIDLTDLLRREPVKLDVAQIASYLEGRTILVTGAGGSIGSELVRQVCRYRPKEVILLGRGENSLYQIEMELRRDFPRQAYQVIVADVRDRERLAWVFEQTRPQVVLHAAAHKHVPLMELNPDEAIFNNVGGTRNLVELALTYEVERFVNISTDKAVNPTSVMGASKRVAEYVVADAARRVAAGRCFVSVRFGNVLGSRGSVVPLFQEQIRRGGPVTVTHPQMTRYFMTIPEAAQLVLQAAGLGGNGLVYVLDMGEPVRIVDLAEDLIRLSGYEPGRDIEIEFTGVRPGEKLFEELLTAEEGTEASRHDKIYVARNTVPSSAELEEGLRRLFAAARSRDGVAIRIALAQIVPTYQGAPAAPSAQAGGAR